jgi:hypothetical protein
LGAPRIGPGAPIALWEPASMLAWSPST